MSGGSPPRIESDVENDHQHHLFVIRLWYEPVVRGPVARLGRACALGQRMYFVSLHDLVDFIVLRSGQPGAAQPDTRAEREQQ